MEIIYHDKQLCFLIDTPPNQRDVIGQIDAGIPTCIPTLLYRCEKPFIARTVCHIKMINTFTINEKLFSYDIINTEQKEYFCIV